MAGPFKQDWLCSTLKRPVSLASCSVSDGRPVSDADAGLGERVTVEGLQLYGLKMTYYCVESSTTRDPLFGEDGLETIDRAFFFTGYVSELPPGVKSYQLQGIWGEDVVTVYAARAAFSYFSTYSGPDRNDPEIEEPLKSPRVGDLVWLSQTGVMYEIVDVKEWEQPFGLQSQTWTITMRVAKDTKRTVSDDPTLPEDDPVRNMSASSLDSDVPFDDPLKLPEPMPESPDAGRIDLFDWDYEFESADEDGRRHGGRRS